MDVHPIDDLPIVHVNSYVISEDETSPLNVSVLATDIDTASSAISISVSGLPTRGRLYLPRPDSTTEVGVNVENTFLPHCEAAPAWRASFM